MKRFTLALGLLIPALFIATPGSAQTMPKGVRSIEAKFEPAEAKPGQSVVLRVTLNLLPGYLSYPLQQTDQREKDSQNVIPLPEPGEIVFQPQIADPKDRLTKPGAAGPLDYYVDRITWDIAATVRPEATSGAKSVTLKQIKLIICDKDRCFPPKKVDVNAVLNVVGGAVPPPMPNEAAKVDPPRATPPVPEKTESKDDAKKVGVKLTPSDDYGSELLATLDGVGPVTGGAGQTAKGDANFLSFLLTASFWGFITLLTPCVFPMVPITVSVFLKQSEKKGTSPIVQASVYALTIILVLGISALTLLSVFRALSVNPYLNAALGLLFVFFALSLFGMYDITLPNWIVNLTSSREGSGGYVGTIFMGLTFSIISFTCVAPFLGGFAGIVSSGNFSYFQLTLGAFAFAASFAAPFFFLALFPSLLKKLPKSGGWMNTIKVVMGFLEFAAAFKFFRAAELRWIDQPTIFTFDFVMASWVVLLAVAGLYLLGVYKLPHDHGKEDHIGVPRLMWAVLFLGLGVYLAPSLITSGSERVRPAGTVYAWVDSFLLPDQKAEIAWSGDLKKSLDLAKQNKEAIFVDFTGVTCTNCKLNEKDVFPKPQVAELLKQYRLVQLYTDTVPESLYTAPPSLAKRDADAQSNLAFQLKYFQNEQLPLYVVLKHDSAGKIQVVAIYEEGKINDEAAFIAFLKKGLGK
jgi:thiol:disulfide interchange protein